MSVKIPIYGLLYSTDGVAFNDPPIPPDSMGLELEQVTAETYRTVDAEALEYTDFLTIKVKISCEWSSMTPTQFMFWSSIFAQNRYIWLKYCSPFNLNEFETHQFKCNNLKFNYELVDKNTALVKSIDGVSQSYTQR